MDNHVILTLGRSGSNTLVDMCNQHPNLLNYGEVLGDWSAIRKLQMRTGFHKANDAAYLDALLNNRLVAQFLNSARTVNKWCHSDFGSGKRLRDVRSVGFKDFSLMLERHGLRDYLRQRGVIKVIGLQRWSLVDRLVSAKMLAKTGIVAQREGDVDVPRLHLDPAALLDDLETYESESKLLDEMLNELPQERVYRIEYEDLFVTPERTQGVMNNVFDFLGVTRLKVRTRMKKIVKKCAFDAIANLEECREATASTRFDHVFRESANA